ncbi:MAG: transposase [Firmicutes bacterium]|nr:transposase [Bacillota bacterium]
MTMPELTPGGDRGVAKPWVTSDGQIRDFDPVQQVRIQRHRKQHTTWQRKASRRKRGSKNQNKAARYQQYEKNIRQDYAQQTGHRLVANDSYDVDVFEDLPIQNMTKRPQAKKDAERQKRESGS